VRVTAPSGLAPPSSHSVELHADASSGSGEPALPQAKAASREKPNAQPLRRFAKVSMVAAGHFISETCQLSARRAKPFALTADLKRF
jgi:hypothetical protein